MTFLLTFTDSQSVEVGVVTIISGCGYACRVDFETYLHRIGRTGRFGRSGLAINFVDGRRTMEMVKKIEEHFGRKIVKIEIDDPDSIERAVAS